MPKPLANLSRDTKTVSLSKILSTIKTQNKNLIVIVGPTAVGKTALSTSLAREMDSEIISADSRQIYKELNVGTAKPSEGEMRRVVHHFVGSHSVQDRFTVYDFTRESHALLARIYERRNIAFLVGGSGLFINAVVNGLDEMPDINEDVREELNDRLEREGLEKLFEQLSQLDPEYAAVVDESNPRRILRALEVCLGTGEPYSSFLRKGSNKPDLKVCKIGLEVPRDELYNGINERVDKMVAAGLVEEARSLSMFYSFPSLRTVGYQELIQYFDNKISLDEAIELIKRNTRRYAKRQLTWFKRDAEIKWFNPSDVDLVKKHVEISVN